MKREVLTDTEDHVSQRALSESSLRLVNPPAVLVVVRGMILLHTVPVALIARPVTLNQDMKALIPKSTIDERYLAWQLRAFNSALLSRVEEAGHGTRCFRTDLLAKVPVAVPPLDEQGRIVKHLVSLLQSLDVIVGPVEKQVGHLREYRQALITAAVTGQLDIGAQPLEAA
jgi:type I restriction enzyme S subunit